MYLLTPYAPILFAIFFTVCLIFFQHITFLDRTVVLDSISHLLPVKVELPPLQNLHVSEVFLPNEEEVTDANTADSPKLKFGSTDNKCTRKSADALPPASASSPESNE